MCRVKSWEFKIDELIMFSKLRKEKSCVRLRTLGSYEAQVDHRKKWPAAYDWGQSRQRQRVLPASIGSLVKTCASVSPVSTASKGGSLNTSSPRSESICKSAAAILANNG